MSKILGAHADTKVLAWVTGRTYNVGDVVASSGYDIKCLTAHVSGTFNTDVQAGLWQMVAPMKNYLANSNFDIWQRATSYTFGTNNVYGAADRWNVGFNGSGGPTVARDTAVPNSNSIFSYKFTAASTNNVIFFQKIESSYAAPLAGKQITVTAWFKTVNASQLGIGLNLNYPTGQDNYGSTVGITINASAVQTITSFTGTWQQMIWTATLPTNVVNGLQVYFVSNTLSGTGETFNIAQVMVNEGPVPASFQIAGDSFASELLACQRYYEKSSNYAIAPTSGAEAGLMRVNTGDNSTAASTITGFSAFKAPKRAGATLSATFYDLAGSTNVVTTEGSGGTRTNGQALNTSGVYDDGIFARIFVSGVNGFVAHWVVDAEI